ncbi:hypothetical protein ACVQ8P_01010 [Dellaglioa sp. BT-FLS60]
MKKSLIISNEQTAGLGKPGRNFISPKGSGIYVTICCISNKHEMRYGKVAMTTAILTYQAINKIYNINDKLKWVNDIILNQKNWWYLNGIFEFKKKENK